MAMTVEEFRQGFRDGTLAFCMPAAHAEISNAFLDEFSERILKMDWRDVSMADDPRIASMLSGDESEDEIVAEISELYGVDVSDLRGLPLWDVIRRIAGYLPAGR
jgi:hypothetical protein